MYYHRESQRSKSDEITCLPELYSFVISRQKKESAIRHMAPPDLVDLLLNLQTLQIIKLNRKVQRKKLEFYLKQEKEEHKADGE